MHDRAARATAGFEVMRRAFALTAALALVAARSAFAGDFDGKHALVCAPGAAAECDTDAVCEKVGREEVDLPDALQVDFKAKLVRSPDGQRSSPIRSVEVEPAVLIVQGSQNGRGWSMVIERASGRLSGTIAEAEGAFVLTGSCTLAP